METNDTNTMKPHEVLKFFRLKKELTQMKLAELVGIAQPNIASYETGKRVLGLNAAKKLAKVLDISYKDLI